MELFEICSNLETVCAELSRLYDLMNICEEGITECAEILRDGDGLSKYAAGRIDKQLSLMEVLEFRLSDATHDLRSKIDETYAKCREEKANRKQT